MLSKYTKSVFFVLLIIAVVFAIAELSAKKEAVSDGVVPKNEGGGNAASATSTAQRSSAILAEPLSNALDRVTKKPFGIYITPQTSPAQPERFKGYHTGVDFETYQNEQNTAVPVSAVCDGKLLMKKWASGYGGVVAQSCTIQNQPVTVIYGHLRLSSIKPGVGQTIKAGDNIAVLGTGYSHETDGERKHLHLGIHKGTSVNILGYVQSKEQLSNWIDAENLMKNYSN